MKKRTMAVIMGMILLTAIGCGQQETSEKGQDAVGEESVGKQESIKEPFAIYQRFLDGEVPAYFREADRFEGYNLTWQMEAETPYDFSEICSIINTVHNGGAPLEELGNNISYAYIDCGADGIAELALLFHDLDHQQHYSEDVTLFIKAVNDRLEVCYIMQSYYKDYWELSNIYGVVDNHINGGTGIYCEEMGYIGADGVYDVVYFVYNDLNSYYFLDLPEDFPYEIPEDEWIVLQSYIFETYGQNVDYEEYCMLAALDLTVPGYHYNTENSAIDIDALSRAVTEATGMELYSPEEILAMAAAREVELGLTEEIKNGPEVEWIPFTGTITVL